jgi:hypothetical protein
MVSNVTAVRINGWLPKMLTVRLNLWAARSRATGSRLVSASETCCSSEWESARKYRSAPVEVAHPRPTGLQFGLVQHLIGGDVEGVLWFRTLLGQAHDSICS